MKKQCGNCRYCRVKFKLTNKSRIKLYCLNWRRTVKAKSTCIRWEVIGSIKENILKRNEVFQNLLILADWYEDHGQPIQAEICRKEAEKEGSNHELV